MQDRQPIREMSGPGMMLLSAAIFGFFGFLAGITWNSPGVDGNPVLFRLLLGWTLRGSAVAFALAAGLTFASRAAGNLLYAVVGLVGAGLFLVIAVMDFVDKQHGSFHAYAPVILVVFAIWNGYGSWTSLTALAATRRLPDHESPPA